MKVLVLLYLVFSLTLVLSAKINAKPNETNAELMQQWITLESQKGKLQTDWHERRQQLKQRLALFELEHEALQQIIKKSSEISSEVDERRLALVSEQTKLETEQQKVSQQLQHISENIEYLMLRLPPPIQEQWQQKITLINDSIASNSEKLERLLNLFILAEDFDRRIAINRTSMLLNNSPDNPIHMMVTQIYIGLSQGWYVNDDGSAYGYGRANKLGWQWWHQQDTQQVLGSPLSSKALLKIRDSLDNPTTATYLALPITLHQGAENDL
ncbi:DUF3450 family protein [Paraglaciecola hydrolytica]|uniref:DUF3450 domain-containing protein n=1 Tax=Paraglaciecola hydrolytica TaxID=1799789 RepID=A0A148KLW9_9ALTE|nr:DUF3450 family protein [Paraglaciecola hydrolytica]KXI27302.1 hypothetical protein AX660_21485 [Paraglaciecola hydrolytica]